MRFRPLNKGFGAEVRDVDLLTAEGPEVKGELVRAFDDYQLLLFRNATPIPPGRHVEIASWFGPAIDTSNGQSWSAMDNENAAGSIRLPFHSDLTYTDTPVKFISLHALEIPAGGASTAFSSGVAAWADLSPQRQRDLEGMTARHGHTSAISSDMPKFEADHPVRLVHPRTGKPVLFVTEYHAERIYELEPPESDRVLGELLDHLYDPSRVYVHEWRLHDLLIWDNLAVQHSRREEANLHEGRRLLQRVAHNEVEYDELIKRAWSHQKKREAKEGSRQLQSLEQV
jgi:taurine dioxygenase